MDRDIVILSNSIMNIVLKYIIIAALILLVIFPSKYSLSLGLIFGGIVAIINFCMVAYSTNGILLHRISRYKYLSLYVIRMLLYVFTLTAGYMLNSLNLVTTIIGLMSLKIVLLIKSFIDENQVFL